MKSISLWAKANRWRAIGILIPLHIILGIFYLYAGVYLFAHGITFSEKIIYLGHGLVLAALACYPIRGIRKGFFKSSYLKKKFWQGVMLLATAVYITNAGNQLARSSMLPASSESFSAQSVILDFKKEKRIKKKQSRKERRLSRKKMKKEFRAAVKKMKKQRKDKNRSRLLDQILLSFLVIILAFFISYAIISFSCSIACSGQIALSVLVLCSGGLLLLLGIFFAFRAIVKMGKPKVPPKPASD